MLALLFPCYRALFLWQIHSINACNCFKDVFTCFFLLVFATISVHPYGMCKCKYVWLYSYFPCVFAWYLYLLYALSGQSLFIFSTELCCHPSYTASQASSYWSSSSFWSSPSFWSSLSSRSSFLSSSSGHLQPALYIISIRLTVIVIISIRIVILIII